MAHVSKLRIKRGKYGRSKVKAFLCLLQYPELVANPTTHLVIPRHTPILTTRQLVIASGISYHSLARALPRWVNFGYVVRREISFAGKFEYQLFDSGGTWLRLAYRNLPNYNLFVAELIAWQDYIPDDVVSDLIAMPFTQFVPTLDTMIRDFRNNGKRA